MKKSSFLITLPILFLIVFSTQALAQEAGVKQSLTQADYLKKSKKQKTWGWVSAGIGTSIVVITAIAAPLANGIANFAESKPVTTVPYIIGGACIATGIVLFVASSKNKQRAQAASVFINMERVPVLQQTGIRNQSLPVLCLRIAL